jgi:hypothetical protein
MGLCRSYLIRSQPLLRSYKQLFEGPPLDKFKTATCFALLSAPNAADLADAVNSQSIAAFAAFAAVDLFGMNTMSLCLRPCLSHDE